MGRLKPSAKRHAIVIAMREAGKTFPEIGEKLGVSASRASEIHLRALELREEEAFGLSARSRLIVEECGHTVDALVSRLARSESEVTKILLRRAGCFQPQVDEIITWLRAH